MTDFQWDFTNNDIQIGANADFIVTTELSNQNATLITMKSSVDIANASIGVALEERYANINTQQIQPMITRAENEIRTDGATSIFITYTRTPLGIYDIDINAKYPQ